MFQYFFVCLQRQNICYYSCFLHTIIQLTYTSVRLEDASVESGFESLQAVFDGSPGLEALITQRQRRIERIEHRRTDGHKNSEALSDAHYELEEWTSLENLKTVRQCFINLCNLPSQER